VIATKFYAKSLLCDIFTWNTYLYLMLCGSNSISRSRLCLILLKIFQTSGFRIVSLVSLVSLFSILITCSAQLNLRDLIMLAVLAKV
jgi:hypothetical protein